MFTLPIQLFFDDCNWGDHCGMVQAACREPLTNMGPAVVRTPNGLTVAKWQEGLVAYATQAEQQAS
jgi:magnesium-dependent phosphatase 1